MQHVYKEWEDFRGQKPLGATACTGQTYLQIIFVVISDFVLMTFGEQYTEILCWNDAVWIIIHV